ncbi:hypothetical protein [Streptobacillus moniliformis]|uniref:hypothetical protein n=1 Tax=Streptobacillus moniliformis TaxID=34105 RepID=UPI0007E3461A|nr:hypothetical protein [Streptobacillus moniliformis]
MKKKKIKIEKNDNIIGLVCLKENRKITFLEMCELYKYILESSNKNKIVLPYYYFIELLLNEFEHMKQKEIYLINLNDKDIKKLNELIHKNFV